MLIVTVPTNGTHTNFIRRIFLAERENASSWHLYDFSSVRCRQKCVLLVPSACNSFCFMFTERGLFVFYAHVNAPAEWAHPSHAIGGLWVSHMFFAIALEECRHVNKSINALNKPYHIYQHCKSIDDLIWRLLTINNKNSFPMHFSLALYAPFIVTNIMIHTDTGLSYGPRLITWWITYIFWFDAPRSVDGWRKIHWYHRWLILFFFSKELKTKLNKTRLFLILSKCVRCKT